MEGTDKKINRLLLVHNARPFSETHLLMLEIEQKDKEKTGYFYMVKHTHIQNTRSFSKTHCLMLAMEGADKKRNRLLLVKHTHIHNRRPISKTHQLILAMEGADKERNRLHTYAQHKTIL